MTDRVFQGWTHDNAIGNPIRPLTIKVEVSSCSESLTYFLFWKHPFPKKELSRLAQLSGVILQKQDIVEVETALLGRITSRSSQFVVYRSTSLSRSLKKDGST